MSVDLAKEIWNELKRYVNSVDKEEAAETLVAVLIDNDVDGSGTNGENTLVGVSTDITVPPSAGPVEVTWIVVIVALDAKRTS